MSNEHSSSEGSTGTGLLGSVRTLAHTLVAALQTRLELLATEVEEERIRLTRLWLLAMAALFLFVLSVLTATLFVVVVFWDTYRLGAIGVLFLLFLFGGCFVAWYARKEARAHPRLFSASLKELAKDRERLTAR
ncbi:MAG TPA: phage holin family protein [Burkholderiales bacterium]|nr:phage holin family protein [Burkholderiales bacterium]